MADADVAITAGTGTKIDTRTVGAGTDEHRQVVTIGDPVTAAQVALVTTDNRLQVKTDYTATAVVTGVAVSTTSVAIIAADGTNGRVGVILYNDTTQTVYVNLNATAATTSAFSFELPSGAYWESPRNFVGAISGITSVAATGNVRVTSF